MKKLHMLFAVLLALATLLSLSACGKKEIPYATDPMGQQLTIDTTDSIGSVLFTGENGLTIDYDKKGEVVGIADAAAQAVHKALTGKSCKDAVTTLLKEADPPIYTNFLLIKQSVTAQIPNETFLQDLLTAAKAIVGEAAVLCPAEDQNEMGYFSAKTAEAVLAAYLGNPANATYSTTSESDGYYEVSATMDGRIENFTVGAYYGRIQQNSSDTEPPIEEELPDYFVDDGTNMYISDNPEAEIME